MSGIARRVSVALLFTLLGLASPARAEPYILAVPPFMDRGLGEAQFGQLAAYLSRRTGSDIRIRSSANPIAFWESLKRGDFDLVLDGPHLVDYRVKRLGHDVVVKVVGVLSFSLVMDPEEAVFEPDELIGKRVAITPAPSLCAVQIEGFYPNLMRRPELVEVPSHERAVELLATDGVDAAFIPTPLTGLHPGLVIIAQSEQLPHSAMTVSPRVLDDLRAAIEHVLLKALDDDLGADVLESMNLHGGFEPADNAMYANLSEMLTGIWAY